MDDQRGELGKHSFELPDFLRIPNNSEKTLDGTNQSTSPPPPPPPPSITSRHNTGSLKVRGENRSALRKTLSSPTAGGDLMSELSDKLRRRSTSENSSIPEGHDVEDEDTSPRSNSSSSSISPWEPRNDRYRRINTVRPKTTDGAVFTVEAVTPVRLDRPLSSSNVMSHSESMPDTLQSRTRSTLPLTVNSARGFPASMSNITAKIIDENKGVYQVHKYNSKQRSLSSSSAPDYSTNLPYLYEAPLIEGREKPRPSIKRRQSDGLTGKGNLSPFHIPHINSRKTEIFVPAAPGIKTYRKMSSEVKARPRPITDSAELMAGLEEDSKIPPIVPPPPPCDLLPNRLSPSSSDNTSPLPYPPSPEAEQFRELEIADFPPPTPLSNIKGAKNICTTPNDDFNKTLTPGTCERTFVEEPYLEGTPYGSHRNSKNINRKSGHNDESWTSKQIPEKLDPYVTYESDDMRITFV